MGLELGRCDLVGGETVQKAYRAKNISVTFNRGVAPSVVQEAAQRGCGQRPIPGGSPFTSINLTDSRDGEKEDAAGLQNTTQCCDGVSHVEDEVQCLCEDNAI